MRTLDIVLYVIAAVCFALVTAASFKRGTVPFDLLGLGLLAWVLVPLITLIRA